MHSMMELHIKLVIDSLYKHSRYIVGVERVQHMDWVEHVEHSLKYANMCICYECMCNAI